MSAPNPAGGPNGARPDAVLAAARSKIANLEIALQSARTIGMAMGVLMALRKISDDDAFELLRHASQASNRKLRDIAADVAQSGTLG